jgi:hypothetical protein
MEEANGLIAKLKEKTQKDLVIETVEKGPERAEAAKWAEKRLADLGADGVYVVISTQPRIFEIAVSPKTRDKGYFTVANRDEVKNILAKNLKDNRDQALVKVAQYVLDAISENGKKLGPKFVKDEAKLFNEKTIKEVNAIVTAIRETHDKDLAIETMEKGPKDAKEFATFTRDRAKKLAIDGVYVLITTEPKHFQVVMDDKTRDSGLFKNTDRDEVVKMLRGLGDDRDDTLLKVATYVREVMDQRTKDK